MEHSRDNNEELKVETKDCVLYWPAISSSVPDTRVEKHHLSFVIGWDDVAIRTQDRPRNRQQTRPRWKSRRLICIGFLQHFFKTLEKESNVEAVVQEVKATLQLLQDELKAVKREHPCYCNSCACTSADDTRNGRYGERGCVCYRCSNIGSCRVIALYSQSKPSKSGSKWMQAVQESTNLPWIVATSQGPCWWHPQKTRFNGMLASMLVVLYKRFDGPTQGLQELGTRNVKTMKAWDLCHYNIADNVESWFITRDLNRLNQAGDIWYEIETKWNVLRTGRSNTKEKDPAKEQIHEIHAKNEQALRQGSTPVPYPIHSRSTIPSPPSEKSKHLPSASTFYALLTKLHHVMQNHSLLYLHLLHNLQTRRRVAMTIHSNQAEAQVRFQAHSQPFSSVGTDGNKKETKQQVLQPRWLCCLRCFFQWCPSPLVSAWLYTIFAGNCENWARKGNNTVGQPPEHQSEMFSPYKGNQNAGYGAMPLKEQRWYEPRQTLARTFFSSHSISSHVAHMYLNGFLGILFGMGLIVLVLLQPQTDTSEKKKLVTSINFSQGLHHGISWLESFPVGFKLNVPLTQNMGRELHMVLNLHETLVQPLYGLLATITFGWFDSPEAMLVALLATTGATCGLSTALALLFDIVQLSMAHISLLNTVFSTAYRTELSALDALWHLFRGQKRNILRQRSDTLESYDYVQLLLGSMVFTILLFLWTTILVYYVFFAVLATCVVQGVLVGVGAVYGTVVMFPAWKLWCWWLHREAFVIEVRLLFKTEAEIGRLLGCRNATLGENDQENESYELAEVVYPQQVVVLEPKTAALFSLLWYVYKPPLLCFIRFLPRLLLALLKGECKGEVSLVGFYMSLVRNEEKKKK